MAHSQTSLKLWGSFMGGGGGAPDNFLREENSFPKAAGRGGKEGVGFFSYTKMYWSFFFFFFIKKLSGGGGMGGWASSFFILLGRSPIEEILCVFGSYGRDFFEENPTPIFF